MNDVVIREGPPRFLKEISVAIETLSQSDKAQRIVTEYTDTMRSASILYV